MQRWGWRSCPFIRYLWMRCRTSRTSTPIYLLFVANTVVSYFYSYKRSLIICDQKKYIETAVHYGAYFLLNVVQIIFLALTKNYVVFLMLQVLSTWLENFILARKADKLYPFLREKNVRPMDKTDSQVIFRNVAAMSMHKVGAVVVIPPIIS